MTEPAAERPRSSGGGRHGVTGLAAYGGPVRSLRTVLAAVSLPLLLAGCTPTAASPADQSASRPSMSSAPVPDQRTTPASSTGDARPLGLPTQADLDAALTDVRRLTTAQLAGQLIVPRASGRGAAAAWAIREGAGGIGVFAAQVPTGSTAVTSTLRTMNAAAQAAMTATHRRWPAFVAVDQEGGPVTRIGAPLTPLPALMAVGAATPADAHIARDVAQTSGRQLAALGFTVVMAPVADVTVPADPTIGVRSPGADPALVSSVAGSAAAGYLGAGVLPMLKHFPGHGSVTTDSHVALPRQRAPMDLLLRRDLAPFRDLSADVPAIMVGHIALDAVDPGTPATLSQPVVTGLLRKRFGFTGLVVTDALEMAAVTKRYGGGEAAVRALEAGVDVVLMPASMSAARSAIVAAVAKKRLTRATLEASAARMVAYLRTATSSAGPVAVPSSPVVRAGDAALAARLAAGAITQVSGLCGGSLVGSSISVSGGTPTDRDLLRRAARAAGLRVGSGSRVVLLGGGTYRAGEAGGERGSASGSGDVVVALDAPYGLARSTAKKAHLATFGRTPATFSALVHVLRGTARAAGRLPVAVGSWTAGAGCPS